VALYDAICFRSWYTDRGEGVRDERTGDHGHPAEETIMIVPTFQYDPDAEAVYIRISQGDVAETVEVTDELYIDVDEKGDPIGIEILGVDVSALSNLPGVQDETELRKLLKGRAA
jgi:uncharacterized protein YuzE